MQLYHQQNPSLNILEINGEIEDKNANTNMDAPIWQGHDTKYFLHRLQIQGITSSLTSSSFTQ